MSVDRSTRSRTVYDPAIVSFPQVFGQPSRQAIQMSPVARLAPTYISTPSTANTTPPPSYRASIQPKPSLDLSQRFERKLAEYNASQNILKRWLFEIVSLAISAICMVCTILDVQGMRHNQISTDGSLLGLHNWHMYLH